MQDATNDGSDDPRLMAAMQEYMAALDAGRRVNRRELVARYPDIAAELSACLQGLSFVHGAAGQLTDGGQLGPLLGPLTPPTDGAGPAASATDGDAAADAAAFAAAAPLGDFRLIREIGRGGMGVVYEATQLSLGRRVAVKVLPMAAALDPRRLQRFRNEAQAAAGLHHTNIVPVYAVGSDRSTHFYAMQLIDGRSLAELIREMRKADAAHRRTSAAARHLVDRVGTDAPPSGTVADPLTAPDATEPLHRPAAAAASGGASTVSPSSAWSGPRASFAASAASLSTLHNGRRGEYVRTVARLGVQAAEALDYAHALGIIHRDIKPANLMVDAAGNLWVTDFGLAQMMGDHGLTQTGDMIGTMRYMSPEQAGGRPGHLGTGRRHRPTADEASDDSDATPVVLDPRTDVYSLGVTLYELLTLTPALPGRTRDDLMVQLAAIDPKPPRAIDKSIPVELQTILAKSYAKDPADRYPSAKAMADDLRRFLADEPIHARPPTAWDHAAKWARRHRSLTLSALVVATVLAAGLGASTLIVSAEKGRAESAFARAQADEVAAGRQRDRAARMYRQARSAVDAFTDVAQNDLPRNPQTTAVRQAMLERALSFYQQLVASQRGASADAVDPDLKRATEQAKQLLDELVATDAGHRAQFNVHLLTRPAVARALKLTAPQSRRAADLDDELDQQAGGGHDRSGRGPDGGDGPSGATDATRAAAAVRLQAAVADFLLPPQVDRLAQISRQLRGARAFDDPEVRRQLGLTAAQTEAVGRIRAAADGGPPFGSHGRPVFGGFSDGRPGGTGPGNSGPGNSGPDDGGPDDGGGNGSNGGGGGPNDGGPGDGGSRDGGPDGGGPNGGGRRATGAGSGAAGAGPGDRGSGSPAPARAVQRVVDEVLTKAQKAAWADLIGPPFTDDTSASARRRGRHGGPWQD